MIYVAHPLAGDIAGNCARAEQWLAALMRDNPDRTFVLPWVDLRIAGRCEGIVLCGPRVSPGMALELAEAISFSGQPSAVWRLFPGDSTRLGESMNHLEAHQLLDDVQNGVER